MLRYISKGKVPEIYVKIVSLLCVSGIKKMVDFSGF